jgi:thiol-disulfide isomerase/thioredoxin
MRPVTVGRMGVVTWVCAAAALAAPASGPGLGIDLQGRTVDPLAADRGKVTVLVYVRTDCPVSSRYAPAVQKLASEYAGKSKFWLVFPAKADTVPVIERYLRDFGYNLDALEDPGRGLVKLGAAEITPSVSVFSAGGELLYHGRIDNWYEDFGWARREPTTHELQDALAAAVKGKRPAVATAPAVGCYISDLQ